MNTWTSSIKLSNWLADKLDILLFLVVILIKRTGETESSYSDDKSNLLGRMSYRQVPVHCPEQGGNWEKNSSSSPSHLWIQSCSNEIATTASYVKLHSLKIISFSSEEPTHFGDQHHNWGLSPSSPVGAFKIKITLLKRRLAACRAFAYFTIKAYLEVGLLVTTTRPTPNPSFMYLAR